MLGNGLNLSFKKTLKAKLVKGFFESALIQLIDRTNSEENKFIENRIYLLLARHHQISVDKSSGTIDYSTFIQMYSSLVESALDLIDSS